MRLYSLRRVQLLPVQMVTAWEFFSSPANLPLITPPNLAFEVTSPLPERMYPGMVITYRVSPFPGVKVPWVTEITHMTEPNYFVDEQRLGPYRFWHHQHHFRELSEGVEVTDLVHYALPLDPLSRPMHFLVERRLDEIFNYRRRALTEQFGR